MPEAQSTKAAKTRPPNKRSAAVKRSRVRLESAGATQVERDRIALGRMEAYMDSAITGYLCCPDCQTKRNFKDLAVSAVQLIRARYDKLRPSLQSIEQTVVDERDKATEDQIVASIQALVTASPHVLEMLLKVAAETDPEMVLRLQPVAHNSLTARASH